MNHRNLFRQGSLIAMIQHLAFWTMRKDWHYLQCQCQEDPTREFMKSNRISPSRICPKSVVPRSMKHFSETHKNTKIRDKLSHSFQNWQVWVSWITTISSKFSPNNSSLHKIKAQIATRTSYPFSILAYFQVKLSVRLRNRIFNGTRFQIRPCLYLYLSINSNNSSINNRTMDGMAS